MRAGCFITNTNALMEAPARTAIRAALLPMYPAPILQGGLELQCFKTCNALRSVGVDATLLDYYHADSEFDLLHLFAGSPTYSEICRYAAGRWPIVVSAVCGGREASRTRPLLWGAVSKLAAAMRTETAYSRMREVYAAASMVLCLTPSEADFVKVTFGVEVGRIEVVPNGVEDHFFTASPDLFIREYGMRDFVLFTGNIVRRKNPLILAETLRDAGIAGVFIGGTVAAEAEYGKAFARVVASSPDLLWIPGMTYDHPVLASAYAAAKLFCLPSDAETQSLSALEAMATGTPILLADRLYSRQPPFEDCARCEPSHRGSLTSAIKAEMRQPASHRALVDEYRWTAVAGRVSQIYSRIVAG